MNDQKYVWIEIEAGPLWHTAKAKAFRIGGETVWIPNSNLGAHKTGKNGEWTKIEVTEWIAKQKGLVEPKAEDDPKDLL